VASSAEDVSRQRQRMCQPQLQLQLQLQLQPQPQPQPPCTTGAAPQSVSLGTDRLGPHPTDSDVVESDRSRRSFEGKGDITARAVSPSIPCPYENGLPFARRPFAFYEVISRIARPRATERGTSTAWMVDPGEDAIELGGRPHRTRKPERADRQWFFVAFPMSSD
jgi:hypothetical protein